MIYQPGDEIAGKYCVIDVLGGGAMGQVYKAEHKLMHKEVAIKVLHQDVSDNPEIIQRFRREAQSAAAIDHENVCRVLDFDTTDNGDFYLVMEYLEGCSLKKKIRDMGVIEPKTAVFILRQLLNVLQAAHDMGIVHRDVKPENIVLIPKDDTDCFVKLLDFGIAHQDENSKLQTDPDVSKTQLGFLYGTPEYIAPEQANGILIDHRVDLYACGIILYEMLTGRPPFQNDSIVVLLHMQIFDPVPHLPETVEHAAEFDEIIQKLLAKEPGARYQSALAVIDVLDKIQFDATEKAKDITSDTYIKSKLYEFRCKNQNFDALCKEVEKRKILVASLVAGIIIVLIAIIMMISLRSDLKEVEIAENGEAVAPEKIREVSHVQDFSYEKFETFKISFDETLMKDPNLIKASEASGEDSQLCYNLILAVEGRYKKHPNYMRLRMQAAYDYIMDNKNSKSKKMDADELNRVIEDIVLQFVQLTAEVPDAARNPVIQNAIGLAFYDSKLKSIDNEKTTALLYKNVHKNLGNALFYAIMYGGYDAASERKNRMIATFESIPDFEPTAFQKAAIEAWRVDKSKCKDRETRVREAFESDASKIEMYFGLLVPLYQVHIDSKRNVCKGRFNFDNKNCNACMNNWVESGYHKWTELKELGDLDSAKPPFEYSKK